MRFSWTLTVSLSTVSGLHGISDILATILAPMEVFRYSQPLLFLSSSLSFLPSLIFLPIIYLQPFYSTPAFV